MNFSKLTISAASALWLAGALAGSAHANPISEAEWATSDDGGGLAGSLVFLNSLGKDPFSIPDEWITFPEDFLFSADFGAAGEFANTPTGNSIIPFGAPDTTSYGQEFTAPGNSDHLPVLSEFDFQIKNNNPGSGTRATFVLATWDDVHDRAETELFSESSFVSTALGFVWNTNALPDIRLTPGDEYVAFLTVAGVPEPSTWMMMALGFASFGFAAYRRGTRRPAA